MPGSAFTILIAEDDYGFRKTLSLTFRRQNFTILEATNGEDAIATCRETQVDGIIIDALMPRIDGFTACEELRQIPGYEDIPILMITGLNDEESIDRAYNSGATDFVMKPVHLGVLSHRLLRLIQAVRLQNQLEHSRREFRTIFDALPDAIVMADPEHRILACNPGFSDRFGYQPAEVIGEYTQLLYADPEDFEREETRIRAKVQPGAVDPATLVYRCRDGSQFIGETTASILRNANQEAVGILQIIRDISERKRAEEERLKADKLATMGLLAGGIAHDFNNIITALMTNLSLARFEVDSGSHLAEYLNDCQPALDQAMNLAKQLLTFAKGGAPIKHLHDVGKLVRESINFALRATRSVACYDIQPRLWLAEVDQGQFVQVISNLVINADQAMDGGGRVHISLGNLKLAPDNPENLPAGSYLELRIRDEGCGIPEERLERIFDPYFTTKSGGSGLGLATVYSIIDKHDGLITAESEVDVGTTFRILLPATRKGKLPDPQIELGSIVRSGRILVLEDQESIRKALTRLLTREGFDVVCEPEGEAIIRQFAEAQQGENPFDLAILDMTIPGGISGLETFQKLQELDPEIRAIVASGYWDDPVMANPQDYGFAGVLPKPFRPAQLFQVVSDVLAAPAGT